ncbi:transposase [Streptomyces sp. SAI-144]|uniref:transposase n=1 Tax=Streptomyces sp. SAI-144 TaxID=2940544 RepID=UPI002473C611|nr:transposase [Streptomyces sp. SAI-144]
MALASPPPITWVTADAAYGQEWRFRRILEETAVGYVLAVPRSQQVPRAAPVTPRLALPPAPICNYWPLWSACSGRFATPSGRTARVGRILASSEQGLTC